MNQELFEKWTDLARKVQEPLQAFAELNVKTMQELRYLKPEDFLEIKKPEELFEKQVQLLVDNGHKALNHLRGSFQIMEKAMLSMTEALPIKTKN